MGELLRAVLDFNSTYSQPAFYTGVLVTPTTAGARTLARRQATIQCKADTYFMVIGFAQFLTVSTPAGFVDTGGKGEPITASIVRSSTQEAFSSTPVTKANANYNLNNFVSLNEYILFEPRETITLLEDIPIINGGAASTQTTTVVLAGIEYRMPAAVGGA